MLPQGIRRTHYWAQTGHRLIILLLPKVLKFTRQPAMFSFPPSPLLCLIYIFISTVNFSVVKIGNQGTQESWLLSGPISPSSLLQLNFSILLTSRTPIQAPPLSPLFWLTPDRYQPYEATFPGFRSAPTLHPPYQGSLHVSKQSQWLWGPGIHLGELLSCHLVFCQEVILLGFLSYPAQ